MQPASVVVTQLSIKNTAEAIRKFAQKLKFLIIPLCFKKYQNSKKNGELFIKLLLVEFLLFQTRKNSST